MKTCTACVKILLSLLIISTITIGCKKKLDDDGGYYDEKTKVYKYVRPTKVGFKKISLKVVPPQPGVVQKINGSVSQIGEDAKSIWLKLADRKPYMILADSLASNSRNDKEKSLRISMEFVSPLGSVARGKKFKKQWKQYTIKVLEEQLLNQNVFIDIQFDERSRKLWGTIYKIVVTKDGEKLRNINLWMVHNGLSYYFIDKGKSAIEADYIKAQAAASNAKSGIWRYQ